MLDAHVHCHECLQTLATEVKVRGGKTKPAEIAAGKQLVAKRGPNGLVFIDKLVPLCPDCLARIEAEDKRQAASRLVLAKPGMVKG